MNQNPLTLESEVALDMLYQVDDHGACLKKAFFDSGEKKKISNIQFFGSHINEKKPCGLAWLDNKMYMMGGHTGQIYEVDLSTGEAKNLRLQAGDSQPKGLTAHRNALYYLGKDQAQLLCMTPDNHQIKIIKTDYKPKFGVGEGAPLGIACLFKLFLYMVGGTNRCLYELDHKTGLAKRVGNVTNFGLDPNVDCSPPTSLFSYRDELYMTCKSGYCYQLDTKTGEAKDTSFGLFPHAYAGFCEVIVKQSLERLLMWSV